MKEAHIRPPELKEKQKTAFLKDVGKLISRYDQFVECLCPACSSESRDYKFQKKGFHYWECSECSTVYVNPRPNQDLLGWFYAISDVYKYWNETIFPETNVARKEKIFIPRVDKIIQICRTYNVSTNSLLEIGSGYGTFIEEIKNRDFFAKVVGLEPSEDLAQSCRLRNLDVLQIPFEEYVDKTEELYDVIVSFEVLEHLENPRAFVKSCHDLLSTGGILILTCPNGKGFDVLELGSLSDTYDHEHLNYFNPDSIRLLLQNSNFDILEVITPGKLDADIVRTKIMEEKKGIYESNFLKYILCEKWEEFGETFQDFLAKNKLSSHMWAVALKNG